MPGTDRTPTGQDLSAAVEALRDGGIVAYPTEGVFGLGCDALDGEAVRRLIALKGRATEKGLIVIAASLLQLEPLLRPLKRSERDQLEAGWPGPLTWIVPAAEDAPDWLTGGRPTLAVRVPGHALARELCQRFRGPVVSTSANRSGEPACRDARCVAETFPEGLDYIIDEPVGGLEGPTEIRDLSTGTILRAGAPSK